MALSVLNNIASLAAQTQLTITNGNLQKALFQLSSGSRINTGADDAAGLAIADGLQANITALTQSARNANDGVGEVQVADGSLAQITTLLNRAVTLATESSTGTVSNSNNAVVGNLNTQFTVDPITNSEGPLGADSALRSLQSSLLNDVTYSTTGNSGLASLASLGIDMNNDGTLTINQVATDVHPSLANVLATNPSAVQSFFQNSPGTGFANNFNNDLVNLTDSTDGIVNVEIAGNSTQAHSLSTRITSLQDRLAAQQKTLTLQFEQVNANLEAYPSLLYEVTAEIGILSGNYSITPHSSTNTTPSTGSSTG